MRPAFITDPHDERLEGYVGLKDGTRIRQRGAFVAVSRPVVPRLLRERPDLVLSVLASPRQWQNLQEAIGSPGPDQIPVFVAEAPILEAVAGFPIHRGCLALARCPALDPPSLWAEGPGWWLGLEGISDHDNVGSLLRTAAVLGARGILQDPSCADPLYRRSVRVSMGAAFGLARAVAPWPELLERCRTHAIRSAALTPAGARELRWGDDPFSGGRWVLWVGAEGPGLSSDLIAACDLGLRIPMADGADSLNVAVAAALAAWAYRGSPTTRELTPEDPRLP